MLSIKRGDTFAFYANMTNELGQPLITDIVNLKSQIRDKSYQLICDLTIEGTETPGRYLFTVPSTDEWPISPWGKTELLMDIQINIEGQICSSDTVTITVVKDVTE